MKRQWFAVIAVFLMVLPGCASNARSHYANNQRIVVDEQYVNEVNNVSRKTGVSVTWVNPPTRRVPVEGDSGN